MLKVYRIAYRLVYHSGMATEEEREILRNRLRRWGKQQRDRDPLVLASLAAGITKTEIHFMTGIGRMTIDRIEYRNQS